MPGRLRFIAEDDDAPSRARLYGRPTLLERLRDGAGRMHGPYDHTTLVGRRREGAGRMHGPYGLPIPSHSQRWREARRMRSPCRSRLWEGGGIDSFGACRIMGLGLLVNGRDPPSASPLSLVSVAWLRPAEASNRAAPCGPGLPRSSRQGARGNILMCSGSFAFRAGRTRRSCSHPAFC